MLHDDAVVVKLVDPSRFSGLSVKCGLVTCAVPLFWPQARIEFAIRFGERFVVGS